MIIGRLVDDSFGEQLRSNLEEEADVDKSSVMSSAGSSGVAVILVDCKDKNNIVINAGANGCLASQDLDAKITSNCIDCHMPLQQT